MCVLFASASHNFTRRSKLLQTLLLSLPRRANKHASSQACVCFLLCKVSMPQLSAKGRHPLPGTISAGSKFLFRHGTTRSSLQSFFFLFLTAQFLDCCPGCRFQRSGLLPGPLSQLNEKVAVVFSCLCVHHRFASLLFFCPYFSA